MAMLAHRHVVLSDGGCFGMSSLADGAGHDLARSGESEHSIGLLETLQRMVGCMYLSDLHAPSVFPLVRRAAAKLDAEKYGMDE